MDYKEFSTKIKAKYPQYNDMDDRELAQKMIAKYPQYNDVTFDSPQAEQPQNTQTAQQPLQGKVQQTDYINQQYDDIVNNNSLTKEQKLQALKDKKAEIDKKIDRDKWKDYGRLTLGGLMQGASMHPIFNIPYVGTGLGGGLFDAGSAIIEGKKGSDIAKQAGRGFLIGETIGAVPYVGKAVGKTKAGQAVINKVASSQVGKTAGKILNKKIYLNDRARRYDEVLAKRAEQQLERATRPEVQPSQYGVANIDSTRNKAIAEQIEKNITPETKILRNFDTESALKNTAKEAKTNFKQNIEDLKAKNTTHEYITNAKQGHFYKTIAEDDLTYGIKEAGQELNSILKDIKKNPNIVNDNNAFSELEERIIKKAEGLPQEVQEEIYNKFYNAYNEAQDFINTSQKVDSYATSQLEQSARSAKGTPKEVKQILKDGVQYEKLTNDELTRLATEAVEKDFNGVYNDLIGRASDNRYSALDFENARQLTKRLFAEGTEEANKMAVNLIDVVSEKGSKAGQAVQAMSLWNDLTPEGAVYKAQKIIKDYNGKIKNGKRIALTNEQIQQIKANQQAVANATDPYEKSVLSAKSMQFIADILPKNAMKKVKALRNLSLLLNAKTLERNIIGNALFNAVDTGSKALAVPIDRLIGKFTKQNTRVLPQLGEYLKGGLQGTKRGYQEALQGIDTRNLGQRFDLGQGRTFQNPVLQKLETGLDVGLRVPDRTFYEATKAESIANQLKARGLKEVTPEIEEIANQEALEAVFQNESKISDLTLDFRRALNKLGSKDFGLGDVLIPYAQTPANLTQQAINYSPLGIGKAIGNLAQGNQRQASLDIARSLIGSGMIGGAYGLTKQGYLTPAQYADNYFKNRQIKENKKLLGETPNQLGDVWYAPFQPMSTLGAVGSAMATGENPIQAGANSLLDLPFLQGVTRAVKTIQEGDPVGAVINTALDAPNQFIPTAVSQIAQLADNTQRETYSDNKAQQALNRMLVKIPFASKTLPAKQNVKGEDVQRYTSKGIGRVWDTFLNPTFINKKQDDRVVQELFEIGNNTDENLLLPVADKKLTINGQKITLNAREFNRYQKLLGQETYSQIADFMNTEEYQYLTDEEKAKAIKKIKTNAKFDTEATLFGRTKNRTRRK